MDVRWAAPAVDREDAQRYLNRLRRRSLFSPMRWFARSPLQRRLELVYLPCRVILFSAERSDVEGFILVNGFARQAQAVRGQLPAVSEPNGLLHFEYPLSDANSLEIARKAFLSWKLGRVAGGKLDSAHFVVGGLLNYPFWAQYVESQSGRISLDLLDAVTGKPGGVMMKQALLEAMKGEPR